MDAAIGKPAPGLWKRGAYLSTVCAVVGCAGLVAVDFISISGFEDIGDLIATILLVSTIVGLFISPFAAIGGALLGWLLEVTNWHERSRAKSVFSGMVIAGIAIVPLLAFIVLFADCARAHGHCQVDFTRYREQPEAFIGDVTQLAISVFTQWETQPIIRGWVGRLAGAGLIALASGAIVGWRLSTLADRPQSLQYKPALPPRH